MARGIKGHEWTAAEDAVIREMPEGGSSVIDVCDRLGVDMVTMKNRLYALRKADPTFPRCMKTGRPSASEPQTSDVPCERDVAAEGGGDVAACGGSDVPTGTLGELEQAMAEALGDVTGERDALRRELNTTKKALMEEVGEKEALRRELNTTKKALMEEIGEKEVLRRELKAAKDELHKATDEREVFWGELKETEEDFSVAAADRERLRQELKDVADERDELQRELKAAKDALQCAAHSAPARDRVAELTEENAKLAEAQVRLQFRLDEAHKSLAERENEARKLALQLEAVRRERDALIEEKECYTEEFEDGVAYYKQRAVEAEKIVSVQVDEMEKVRCESRRLAAEVCEVNRIVVGLVAGYVLNHTEEVDG
jgi:uncharacterized protein (DUF3084 family)